MTKNEVAAMFEFLLDYYPDMSIRETMVESWQRIIYFMRKEEVWICLQDHIKQSSYPPKIADIYNRWHGNMYPKSDHKPGD